MRVLYRLLRIGLLLIAGSYAYQVLCVHASPPTAPIPIATTHPNIPELFDLTNQERAKAGLTPVVFDSALNAAATAKCTDMVSKHYWDHIAPDGTRWDSFITAEVPVYQKAAENLSVNWQTSQQVIDGWMGSPHHREAILTPQYDSVGFAICNDTGRANMVVQDFVDHP